VNRPRIFVSIPSYRDRECQWTLRDIFERARHPERVFAGVCWQTVPEQDHDCFLLRPCPTQVRNIEFHALEARGLGWARAKAQSLWQGEEYSLQIASHMRFADDWDEQMLDLLSACDAPDPVLTVDPLGYEPPDQRKDFDRPHMQMIRRFLPNGLLEFTAAPVPREVNVTRPMPTAAVAGGFIFGSSRILRDVPSDPEIYFCGEEPNLAVRLWTAGFDFFSPHVVVVYQYYLGNDNAWPWNDTVSRQMHELQDHTLRRLRLLCEPSAFTPEEVAELGRYGLGTRRTLAAYEAFAGVNFAARSIAIEARRYPFVRTPATRAALELSDTLRLAPETQLFILGDEGVLFNEANGTLHRLNEAAARNWCALEAGWGWERIGADAAAARGISADTAMAELRELAAHWIGEGLLRDTAQASTAGPRLDPASFAFRSRDYRLLDTVVRLVFGDDTLEALIEPAFAHIEVDSADATRAVTITIFRILEWYYIFAGDDLLLLADTPRKLVPKLKAEMVTRAITGHDHILHLHSAAVMLGDCLVLFPAPSGSGKSLLAARLLSLGAVYFSDEAVLLRRDGTVRPVPTALSVKAGGLAPLAAHFPKLCHLTEHDREDGVSVRYLPPPRASLPSPERAAQPTLVVFPRHAPAGAVEMRPLRPADALGRLLGECLAIPRRLDTEAVTTIIETVERAACFDLVTGDLDVAASQVIRMAEKTTGG
jgi:hypothetical protein